MASVICKMVIHKVKCVTMDEDIILSVQFVAIAGNMPLARYITKEPDGTMWPDLDYTARTCLQQLTRNGRVESQ